jgi:hypothetical protein
VQCFDPVSNAFLTPGTFAFTDPLGRIRIRKYIYGTGTLGATVQNLSLVQAEEKQNELAAWKFTPDSATGKRLMAKCRQLYQVIRTSWPPGSSLLIPQQGSGSWPSAVSSTR